MALLLNFSCKVFRKTLKLQKMSKHWKLKGTGVSLRVSLIFSEKLRNQAKLDKTEKLWYFCIFFER